MTHKSLIALLVIFCSSITMAQETDEKPKGKISGKVFFNYHIDFTKDVEQTSAFELTRAYFGYTYSFNDKFTAKILLDAGKGSGVSDYSLFIKNAKLDYNANNWITLSAGVFGMKQYELQENFWGYRYIYKSLADEYKLGSSADLGVMAAMKVNDKFNVDVLIVNGEGYKKLQDASGGTRIGVNLVYKPNSFFVFKGYFDTMKGIDIYDETKKTRINNIALFAGYKTHKFRIGAEYNILQNAETYKNAAKNENLQGLSFYSSYNLNSKWSVFGRYDQLSSNKVLGEINSWNFSNDADTFIVGAEFKPDKKINTSINYRFTNFKDDTNNNASLIYFNLEFYF